MFLEVIKKADSLEMKLDRIKIIYRKNVLYLIKKRQRWHIETISAFTATWNIK